MLPIVLFYSSCERQAASFNPIQVDQKASAYEPELKSLVFVCGTDQGASTYYQKATQYFSSQEFTVVENLESLEEILFWLHENGTSQGQPTVYEEIHIVSHSNPWRGLSLKAKKNGRRITKASLLKFKETATLPLLDAYIKDHTKIVFHACSLGQNIPLLQEFKSMFTTETQPRIIASKKFTVLGSSFAAYYLATPYVVFHPTANSPGPNALRNALKRKYPDVNIDWKQAQRNQAEQFPGQIYSYRFNIPVEWNFRITENSMIPDLSTKELIMKWIITQEELADELVALNIPIDKYRWRYKIQDGVLKIFGKSTALCILQPNMQSEDPFAYQPADYNDKELYTQL